MRLIIATTNQGKLREIKKILRGTGLKIISLVELETKFKIKENGRSFATNAAKKALAVSRVYKDDLVVGEDSGLVVMALGGKPGVYSARYAGAQATDLKNNQKLLNSLKGKKNRKAYYVCALVLAKGGKKIRLIEAKFHGQIALEMKGTGGFGYDPLFYLCRYKKTVAQLPLSLKNKLSHRAQAFRRLKAYLQK